jgi:RNA polymerase sigma factor (TIGR02999 family)
MSPKPSETAALLTRSLHGDRAASSQLFEIVQDDLKALARKLFVSERTDHTLQPTALVNEAYLRLRDCSALSWQDRAHFYAIAARAMRHVLIDHARARLASKRGGGQARVSLHESMDGGADWDADVLALDEALNRLAELDERKARVVELRFLGGLSVEEVAHLLEVSKSTVEADWRYARAWLSRELSAEDEP